jgi:DNA-binding transcriptional LysR family regulator
MELRQLRYFVAVAEELHFGRAAARIGIEQSPLSKAIKDFESDLCVKLMVTTTRRTELTSAGEMLLAEARQILESVTCVEKRLRRFAEGLEGHLTIAISQGLLAAQFMSLLNQFRSEATSVEIIIEEMSVAEQIVGLAHGTIDLGFAYSFIDTPTVMAERLSEHGLRIAMTSDHRLAEKESLSLSDICLEPLALSRSFLDGGAQFQIDTLLRSRRPVISEPAASIGKLLMSVRARRGIALLTESESEWIRHPDIVFRPLANKRNSITAYMLRRREATSALLRRVIEKAKEIL